MHGETIKKIGSIYLQISIIVSVDYFGKQRANKKFGSFYIEA